MARKSALYQSNGDSMAKRGLTKKMAAAIKRKHGADCFKRWGKKGGNPALMKGK